MQLIVDSVMYTFESATKFFLAFIDDLGNFRQKISDIFQSKYD